MSHYSVVDAKNGLSSLIDKAADGDEVIITRHGKPIVELRALATTERKPNGKTYSWLRARRDARIPVEISSVELLDQLYDEA